MTSSGIRNGISVLHDRGFLGVRVGRWYVQVKDTRLHRAYFSERYRYGCKHLTVGHWRVVVRRNGWN